MGSIIPSHRLLESRRKSKKGKATVRLSPSPFGWIKAGTSIFVSQRPGGPVATQISLDKDSPYRISGLPKPRTKPKITVYPDLWPDLPIETHEGTVVWDVPLVLLKGRKHPKLLEIGGAVTMQTGSRNDARALKRSFTARIAEDSKQPVMD